MIDARTRAERLEGLRGRMAEAGLDLVALAPSDNLRYVLGFAPHYDERACMLLVTRGSAAVLMPSLNAEQAAADAPELELVTWSDDAGPADALRRTLEHVGGNGARRAGVDPEMRADHLLLLQEAIPGASCVDADGRGAAAARGQVGGRAAAAAGRLRRRRRGDARRLRRLPAGRDRARGRGRGCRGVPRRGLRGGRVHDRRRAGRTARSRTTTPATARSSRATRS